jgi:hypothetical protein
MEGHPPIPMTINAMGIKMEHGVTVLGTSTSTPHGNRSVAYKTHQLTIGHPPNLDKEPSFSWGLCANTERIRLPK